MGEHSVKETGSTSRVVMRKTLRYSAVPMPFPAEHLSPGNISSCGLFGKGQRLIRSELGRFRARETDHLLYYRKKAQTLTRVDREIQSYRQA